MSDYLKFTDNFKRTEEIESECIISGEVKKPFLTIAIPTYKRSERLKETIESALCQDQKIPYEILIVDNNPERNDETEAVIRTIKDPKIRYYKNVENIGMCGNWNRLYTLAKGEWVTMIHDDDLLCRNFLIDIIPYLQQDIDIISGTFYPFNEKPVLDTTKIVTKAITLPVQRLWRSSGLIIAGLTIKKETIEKIGGFNPNYQNLDCVLITQVAQVGRAVQIQKPLTAYRIESNDSMNSNVFNNCIIDEYKRQQYILRQTLPDWLAKLLQIDVTLSFVESWNRQFNVDFESPLYRNTGKMKRMISKFIGKIYGKINLILYPSNKVIPDVQYYTKTKT